jgi:2'-5' RNA ligase
MAETRRLFVAIDVDSQVLTRVIAAAAAVRRLAPDARWRRADAGHVTLAFLGSVAEARVAQVADVLAAVAARHGPFGLEIRGAGVFGAAAHPRVLWVGIGGDGGALAAVHAAVSRALVPLGYEPEARAYHPHLTLARARAPRGDRGLAAARRSLGDAAFGTQRVDTLVLYQSRLRPGGAEHTALARCSLATG